MNTTTQPPDIVGGDVALSYVLFPFFFITLIGIVVAVVLYLRRKQRIDRLRHQLLPVYTYDPSEDVNEAQHDILWREENTKVGQGWMRTYQQRWPLLTKDTNA